MAKRPDATDEMASQLPFLRSWRKRRHLSQEQLGEKAGFTQGQISQWETGESDIPMSSVRVLADALQIKVWQLISIDPRRGQDDLLDILAQIPESSEVQAVRLLKTLID